MDIPDSPGLTVDAPTDEFTTPVSAQRAYRPEVITRVEELRDEVMTLTSSERLDKDCALQVTRLFHSMEMLLRHACHTRDAEIARVRTDLEHLRLTNDLDRPAARQIQEDVPPQLGKRGSQRR